MLRPRILIVLAFVLVVGLSEALCCSIRSTPLVRDERITYLIGTALAEVVSTPIHDGQIVSVHRIGGAGAVSILELFGSSTGRIVLVPWAYETDCATVPWNSHPIWAPVDTTGFFRAVIRPEDEWAGDIPTLDVYLAWHEPYPHASMLRYQQRQEDTEYLTPEQMWEFYQALPEAAWVTARGLDAFTSLWEWRKQNPELASRFPARRTISFVTQMLDDYITQLREPSEEGTAKLVPWSRLSGSSYRPPEVRERYLTRW